MDVVGSEIGQKMRSAIKAKLTELGCYVDDELPDYVMVMVANKRTQLQMEEDLQLFLGDNTELFVNWLHQVLKKLQEVSTVTVPPKNDQDKQKEISVSKEKKPKERKEKSKKSEAVKKSKKKEKEKTHKKVEKKLHKSKKDKKKSHERIRPNIPPLLMNMEKESEPSITDVFAGQILKNHGVSLESFKDDLKVVETKPLVKEIKRPILPIIDPATIQTQSEAIGDSNSSSEVTIQTAVSNTVPSDSQLKEMNDIETKIQGLKQKLAEQLDSMSDDEDFLNIRTEAEELMNDFADDVIQEISQPTTVATPPTLHATSLPKTRAELPKPQKKPQTPPKEIPKDPIETLPQIELNLPKRPIRERLGAREMPKKPEVKETEKRKSLSPESFTPEREIDIRPQAKSAKSRLGSQSETHRKASISDDSPERTETYPKKITSKVSVLERPRASCASVVRVRPRPRAPASNLLLRAVADAHKSLLNIPPKVDPEPQKVKRALVLPMRRCVDAKKIVIQVAADRQTDDNDSGDYNSGSKSSHRLISDRHKDEYPPFSVTKRILNTDYVPTRTASQRDDSLIIETINIHNPTVDKDKDTQFIVTMDGYHPNAFLAKKLRTEGLLDDDDGDKLSVPKIVKEKELPPKNNIDIIDKDAEMQSTDNTDNIANSKKIEDTKEVINESDAVLIIKDPLSEEDDMILKEKTTRDKVSSPVKETEESSIKAKESTIPMMTQKKRLSNTSEDSDTQVIIKKEDEKCEKRKSTEVERLKESSPPVKKRKASPIVFDVDKKEIDRPVRERTLSASSDSHVVTLSTVTNSHKYDSIPPLSQAERKIIWCRAFPLCRYGASCAFAHPRCKFLAACTRRGCVYSHSPTAPANPQPVVASHVVPVANYKTISTAIPSMCKYYPNCANPTCHFYHPKPCRFGKACANKLECNFYHNDAPPKYSL